MSITSRALVVVGVVALTSCGSGKLPPGEAVTTRGQDSTTIASAVTIEPDVPAASAVPETNVGGADAEPLVDATTSESWEDVTSNLVGLESTCWNISLVATHPDRDEVVAGIASHGLWSLDRATGQWLPLEGDDGETVVTNKATSIEYDPDDPDRFWQSGAYGAGVFRTDDGGRTFRGLGDIRHLDSISVDKEDPLRQVMVSGAHERRAVYRSTDGGESWTDVSDGLPADVGSTSYALVIDKDTFLVGSYGAAGAGIFRTTDAGESWSRLYAGAVRGPPLYDKETIFWLLDGGAGILKSADDGATFDVSGSPFGSRATNLDLLPDGRLITVGDQSIVVSDDDGRTWRTLGPRLPMSPSGIAFSEHRSAIYVWQFTCIFGENNPVNADSILKLDVSLPSP